MPFGSFGASENNKTPRKEKPKKIKKEKPIKVKEEKYEEIKTNIATDIPAEEYINDQVEIDTDEQSVQESTEIPLGEPVNFEHPVSNSSKLRIRLWGGTVSDCLDFLCSVYINMSDALHNEGMTYFTMELHTRTDIIDRKVKLERYFNLFSNKPWNPIMKVEDNKKYTFTISPSGDQSKTLDLIFNCYSYEQSGDRLDTKYDIEWYLVDGKALDEQVGYDDYREFIVEHLQNSHIEKTQCLIPCQIENIGHFNKQGEVTKLKDSSYNKILNICRSMFSCPEGVDIAIIPVQIYGGLDYVGTDISGDPILRLSQSGYFQSYIPIDCQIPLLYSVQMCTNHQKMDFLVSNTCSGVKEMIHHHFSRTKGQTNWQPDILKEEKFE